MSRVPTSDGCAGSQRPICRTHCGDALIDELVAERRVLRSGAWLHLPDHTVRLSEADRALAQALQPLLAEGRFDPPWVRDLAASVQAPEERVREVLRKHGRAGRRVSGRA